MYVKLKSSCIQLGSDLGLAPGILCLCRTSIGLRYDFLHVPPSTLNFGVKVTGGKERGVLPCNSAPLLFALASLTCHFTRICYPLDIYSHLHS